MSAQRDTQGFTGFTKKEMRKASLKQRAPITITQTEEHVCNVTISFQRTSTCLTKMR